MTKRFRNNADVAFGDINLSTDPVRGNHQPGAGGWPTIKYFNKDTGYDGAPYPKKTSKAMCEELGDEAMMQAYVEEMGATSLCSAQTGMGCSDKEKGFIDKWKGRNANDLTSQLARISGMTGSRMKDDVKEWLNQRIAIIKQLLKTAQDDESGSSEEL